MSAAGACGVSSLRACRILAALAVVLLCGCVTQSMPHYTGSPETGELIRSRLHEPIGVGEFRVAPDNRNASHVFLRGGDMSPISGNFADYLKQGVRTELELAGRFKADAPLLVHAVLEKNEVDASGISVGTALVAARFRLTRTGQPVYDKLLEATAKWESSFVGVTAYRRAADNYPPVFRTLIARLFTDPDFLAAAGAR